MTINTFFEETIDPSDWGRLVITSKDTDFTRIFNFEGKEKANSLDALSTPINIISQKKIAWLGW